MEGIFTLIGVILGFYLSRFSEVNVKVAEKIAQIKTKAEPKYGEPFVVRTDEAELDRKNRLKQEREEKEEINVEKLIK